MPDDPTTATPTEPEPDPDTEPVADSEPAADAATEPETAAGFSSAEAREAWDDVIARMAELGEAVARWTRTAVNDPTAKQKLAEIRRGISDITSKGEETFSHVADSDAGKQFAQSAEHAGAAIGDAAQQFSTVAAPHVKSAFEGLAGIFGKAAERIDEATRRHEEAAAAATSAPPAPAPAPDIPEPPADTAHESPASDMSETTDE